MAESRESRPSSGGMEEMEIGEQSLLKNWSNKASMYHSRVPYLKKLPFPALAIIATLVIVNLLVWAAVGIVLVSYLIPWPCEYELTF